MKKCDFIAALAPLNDDTEILLPDSCFGGMREKIEYIDDRNHIIRKNQVRLCGYRGQQDRLIPPRILGVDPLLTNREMEMER